MPDDIDFDLKRPAGMGLLDPERVDRISVPMGTVYPWQMNRKACICQICRKDFPAGKAMRFMKFYKNPGGNGYYCPTCLAAILRTCDWHWNPVTEELFPRRVFTQRPVSGEALSKALLDKGERGLFWVVTGGKRT